jgi:hypothetical protein
MNEIQARLLRQVEDFCRKAGMTEASFGRRAVNDGKLVTRLRQNTITLNTVDKIEAFLADQEPRWRNPEDRQASA